MNRVGFTRSNSTLKTYTPLKAKTGFKKTTSSLKRSSFKKSFELTPKKELDMIVSQVVRLSAANEHGIARCVTCGNVWHWKQMQCGHFQRRAHMVTRYDMRNLGVQCITCNEFNDGMEEEFAKYIDETHGAGTTDLLRKKAREISHDFPFEQEIAKWGAVLEKLLESRNNQIQY